MDNDDSYKKLQKYTAFCRKNGILELKVGSLEIKLTEKALFPLSKKEFKQIEEEVKTAKGSERLLADQLLFYSVDTSALEGEAQ